MTDTNQLPEPELGYIQTDKSNQPAFSARQMREAMKHALQALAQVQGDSASVTYGCHCDLDPGMKPDGCVLDYGNPNDCVHARGISNREECHEWRPIHITTPQPAHATQADVTKGVGDDNN